MNRIKRFAAIAMLILFAFSAIPFSGFAEDAATEPVSDTAVEETKIQIFADVDATTRYYKAIEELYTKKIVDGYLDENGVRTFKPEATITRGEFAKLLSVAMPNAIKLDLNVKSCGFTDVDSDATVAWTIPYVKAAADASVVKGYEDGSFRASNPVSYAEAVKMIVCAMGYSAKIPQTDPWYDGYILVANQLKVTLNAVGNGNPNEEATRGLVAQLFSNMTASENIIPITPPGQTGSTTGGGSFNLNTGDDEDDEDEAYGMMIAAFEKTVAGGNTGLSKNQVNIAGEFYEIGDFKLEQMEAYVGYNVDITYKKERTKKKIIKIEKGDATDYKVTSEQFEEMDGLNFKYYETKDSKLKTLKFSTDTYIIYNGEPTGRLTQAEITNLLTLENGYVTMIDNDSNKTIEVAYIYNYETYFVGALDQSTYTVTDLYAKESDGRKKTVVLNEEENENISFKLLNSSGNLVAGAFGTITKNSVISVAKPYADTDDAKIEVIISKKTVKGTVSAKGDDYVTINSNKYNISQYYLDNCSEMTPSSINAGDTATFYLDYSGQIVATLTTDTRQYGYIANVEIEEGSASNTAIVKMITTTNTKVSSYTLKDTVTVNGDRVKAKDVPNLLKASADAINTGGGKEAAGLADNAIYSQPVIFETSSSTSTILSSITTVSNGSESDSSKSLEYSLGKIDGAEQLKYKSYGFYRGTSRVFAITTSSTSNYKGNVFVVPTDRLEEDEYQVYKNASYFKTDYTYHVEAFNVEESTKYGNIIVVYGATPAKIDGSYKACLVTDIADVWDDEEEETIKELHYIELGVAQANKEPTSKTVQVKNPSYISGISVGDIIKFATKNNAGTEVVLVEKVFVDGELYEPFNGADSQDLSTNYIFQEKYGSDTDYFNAMIGHVYEANETNLQLILGYEVDDSIDDLSAIAETYTVSGSATHVIIVNKSKIGTKDNAIQYFKYSDMSLNSVIENNLGSEDFIYVQRTGTGRINGIVVYKQ